MADTDPAKPARAPRKRPSVKAPSIPQPQFELITEPCPMVCEKGEVPVFDPQHGSWARDTCRRCMGAGVIEVQRGG